MPTVVSQKQFPGIQNVLRYSTIGNPRYSTTHKIESKNSKLILVINILQYFEDNCKSLSCNLNFANSEQY